jgi:hypothetical protein
MIQNGSLQLLSAIVYVCVRWLHYFDLLKIRLFFFFRKNWNDTTTNQKLRYGLIICKYVNVVKTWSNLYIMQFLWFDGRIHLWTVVTVDAFHVGLGEYSIYSRYKNEKPETREWTIILSNALIILKSKSKLFVFIKFHFLKWFIIVPEAQYLK